MTANPPPEPGSPASRPSPMPTASGTTGRPNGRSLGDEADYQRWIRDASVDNEQAPPAPPDGEPTGQPSRSEPFDDLVFIRSSLAESSLVALSRSTTPGIRGTASRPVWSEPHRSWLLRDRRVGRWYRHDSARDQWVLLDP